MVDMYIVTLMYYKCLAMQLVNEVNSYQVAELISFLINVLILNSKDWPVGLPIIRVDRALAMLKCRKVFLKHKQLNVKVKNINHYTYT